MQESTVIDFLFWILVGWLGGSVAVGIHAHKRGRSGGGWFALSLITSPILAWLIMVSLKKKASDTAMAITAQNQMLFDALAPEAKARVIEAQEQREATKHAATLAHYRQRRLAVWVILAVIFAVWIFGSHGGDATKTTQDFEQSKQELGQEWNRLRDNLDALKKGE